MFERFTEPAREAIVTAQEEARSWGHHSVGTEHLFLGLVRVGDGLAAHVLASLGVTLESVRSGVERIVGKGDEVRAGQIPFTPRAKKVLELALREALGLEHDYIGTEHLLLGITRVEDGVAARILSGLELDGARVRAEVIRALRDDA